MTVAVKVSFAANGPAIPAELVKLTSNAEYAVELAAAPALETRVIDDVSAARLAVAPCTTAAAFEGTADIIPRPKAATATSAMRLKVVFVDICFLSISRVREFPDLGFG
jgi:hypothetical protein